jgi:hypothetical protein
MIIGRRLTRSRFAPAGDAAFPQGEERMCRYAIAILSAVLASAPLAAHAASYGLGSKLTPVTLEDQHGKKHTIGASTRVIVLTRDMNAGDVVKAALARKGKTVLEQHRAVYVADVSSMPGFVRKYLALPKLKERPYPMLLDAAGELSRSLPSRENHATVIFLDGLRITAVEYVTRPETFGAVLDAPKRFATH